MIKDMYRVWALESHWGSQTVCSLAGPGPWQPSLPMLVWTVLSSAVLGALLYCFTLSILPLLPAGFSASVERMKTPFRSWFSLTEDDSAVKGALCICPTPSCTAEVAPCHFQMLPPARCSHMCSLILQKMKPAEKNGEREGCFGLDRWAAPVHPCWWSWLELTQGRGCRLWGLQEAETVPLVCSWIG